MGFPWVHFVAFVHITVNGGSLLLLIGQLNRKMNVAVLFLSSRESKFHLKGLIYDESYFVWRLLCAETFFFTLTGLDDECTRLDEEDAE